MSDQTHYICVGNNHSWGRAETEKAAIANMKREGGISSLTKYRVYVCCSRAYVEEVHGSIMYPQGGYTPMLVKEWERKGRKELGRG